MGPWLLLLISAVYFGASLVAIVAYWRDKRAATRGQWRTPERTLHTIELLGGWPGALLAQRLFRHKTRDPSYRLVFFGIIALHGLLWIAGLWLFYGR